MKNIFSLCIFVCSILLTAYSQNLDINTLHSINSNNSASWDNACQITSKSITPVCIAVPVGLFTYGLLKHDSTTKRKALVTAAGILVASAITQGIKYLVNRERPFNTYAFIEKKSDGGDPSFPSGHTSAAFATATSLSLCYPKWYVIAPSFLWAGAVGYSRMELGVHYPTDVMAGALVGAGFSWITWKVNKLLAEKKKNKPSP